MKIDLFSPHRRIELEVQRSIEKLFAEILKVSAKKSTTPKEIQKILEKFINDPLYLEEMGARIAQRMVTHISVSNARSWSAAAQKAGRGREIYGLLQREMLLGTGSRVHALVSENAKLIASIPEKIREEINNEIADMQREGLRHETISEHIRKRVPQITKSRAALIARTESGKASTALTQARSEDLGIEWYQWATSEDQRVRPSHRIMDKVLVSWTDPPSPEALDRLPSVGRYAPGEIYNCRCVALPLVDLNVIAWPAVVYMNGSLRRMTRAQFLDISGMQGRAA